MSARGPLDFDEGPGGAAAPGPAAEPAAGGRPPVAPAPRYAWVVGIAALVLVAVLLIGTVRHGTGRGSRGVPVGSPMPPFAAPLALSSLDGDVNLATHAGDGAAGARPACSVRGPRVLNGCALAERGPVVLTFFATRGKTCIEQLDGLERVRRRLPGVQFAAIAIRGDRGDVRALIRGHRWGFPVGYDRDGGLANAYHVQLCPQTTFARRGGRVAGTAFGLLADRELLRRARQLAPPR